MLRKTALAIAVIAATLAAAFVGCGSSTSSRCDGSFCLEAKGDDAGTLAECLPGAWISNASGSCAPIPCNGNEAGPPECGRSDCVKWAYVAFAPGVAYQSSFIVSPSGNTWTSAIPPEQLRYTIDADRIVWTDAGSAHASCTAQEFVLGNLVVRKRASPGVANGLLVLAADGGVWTGLPYP